jgi:hypothetical protein
VSIPRSLTLNWSILCDDELNFLSRVEEQPDIPLRERTK